MSCRDSYFVASSSVNSIRFAITPKLQCSEIAWDLPDIRSISRSAWRQSCLSRPSLRWFVPPVVTPPILLHCTDRSFLERQTNLIAAPLESLALYGLPPDLRESEAACTVYSDFTFDLPPLGLIANSPEDQLPLSTMQVPEAKRLIYD